MKLKDIKTVQEDFSRVQIDSNDKYCQFKDEIKKYFEDVSENYAAPLANNYAAVMCSQYVEFLHGQLFPSDGSWVQFRLKDKDGDMEAAERRTCYLRDALAASGFYSESAKMLKEGVLYNHGFLTTSYTKGLSFRSAKDEHIYVSKGSDAGSMRGYIVQELSGSAIADRFGRKAYDELYNSGALQAVHPQAEYDVTTAILPCSETFFTNIKKSGKMYVAIHLIEGSGGLMQIPTELEYFEAFPLVKHMPTAKASLASQALSSAVMLNEYEQLMSKSSRRAVNPTMAVHSSILSDNKFNMNENGTVPFTSDFQKPTPIESTRNITITIEHIRRLERYVDTIFKKALIERASVTNVSQFEVAENSINVLRALQPSIGDLEEIVTRHVLTRVDALLRQNDSEYRRLTKDAEGDIIFSGIRAKIEKLSKSAGAARIMQALAPVIQTKPEAALLLDEAAIAKGVAAGYGVSDYISSDEEVEQKQQEIAQQQQAQQEQEALAAEADAANKLGIKEGNA